MAQVVRPLMLSPASTWPLRRCINSLFDPTNSISLTRDVARRQFFNGTTPSILLHRKNLHCPRSRGLRPVDAPLPPELSQSDSESSSYSDVERKSRNEKKREARRAVRWGMELSAFNDSQIKRILSVASLDEEVFDALMLVKRFGRDVREGKRRQFSYIGKLLREVQPELMDGLIRATKDGDQQKFHELSGSDKSDTGETIEEEEEIGHEDEEEGFSDYLVVATRWFDGLVNKDVNITNEIYSLSSVEFDRQELRRLVRNFCSMREGYDASEGETETGLVRSKRLLTRFLLALAKQLPAEEDFIS